MPISKFINQASFNFEKDPIEDLDYGFNLIDWLASGESIASTEFSLELVIGGTTVEMHDPINDGTSFAVFIRGGEIKDRVRLLCKAVTDGAVPRTFARYINLAIVRRGD